MMIKVFSLCLSCNNMLFSFVGSIGSGKVEDLLVEESVKDEGNSNYAADAEAGNKDLAEVHAEVEAEEEEGVDGEKKDDDDATKKGDLEQIKEFKRKPNLRSPHEEESNHFLDKHKHLQDLKDPTVLLRAVVVLIIVLSLLFAYMRVYVYPGHGGNKSQ